MKKHKKCRLSLKQRLIRIQRGLDHGLSNRRISEELGCDESTVRRDRKVLALPARHRLAIKEGMPVTLAFTHQQRDLARDLHHRRIAEETACMTHSRNLAAVIIDWLRTFPLCQADVHKIVQQVDVNSFHAQTDPATAREYSEFAQVMQESLSGGQPTSTDIFELMNWLMTFLTSWLTALEPSREIRDRALRIVATTRF